MRRFAACYLLIAVLVTASVSPAQEGSEQEALTKKVGEIQKEVAKIRGKNFKKDVPVGMKDREELKKFVLEEMEKETPDEVVRRTQKVLEKFGLIKKETDLKKILVDVYIEQVAGFYDPEKEELFITKKAGFKADSREADMAVAHELTHALQDQYFDLRSFSKWVRNNDDKRIALQSVEEGEATLLGFDYLLKKASGKSVKDFALKTELELATRLKGDSALDKAPAVIKELFLFPYTGGTFFCQQVLQRNDWQGFDRVFENPPQSTEQILHPEKYLEKTDYPTTLKMPELLKLFESGWQLLDENCFGELEISILIRQFLTPEDAKKASEGWDGDRYQALEEKKTGKIIIAWITTWDTKEDAQEFAKLYTSVLAKKYDKKPEAAQNASFIFVSGDCELACVEQCGTEVIVIDGASKAETEKVRPELLKTVKVVPEERALEEFAKQPFSVPAQPAEKGKEEPEKKPESPREF
jgi:hypothetical protein